MDLGCAWVDFSDDVIVITLKHKALAFRVRLVGAGGGMACGNAGGGGEGAGCSVGNRGEGGRSGGNPSLPAQV